MQAYYKTLQGALVKHFGVDENLPYLDLPEEFQAGALLRHRRSPIAMSFGANGKAEKAAKPFEGLVPQMQRLYEETESEFTRNRIRAVHDARAVLDLQRRAAEAGDSRGHDQGRRTIGS